MDGIFGYFSGAAAGGATQVNAKSRVPDDDDNIEFAKEDLDAWLVLFKKFDLNNDGGIDMTEFDLICESAAKERGDPPRDSQWIIRAFHEADKDGSGHIDFREFVMVAYRHKATVVDPMYEQNYGAGSKKDKETASRAARHVTSVPVLRETLELAKQSKDPALVREAQRLLYALGDAGKATLAGLVFEEGGDYHDSKDGVKRLVPGNRGNVLGELALGGVGNLVDAAVVRDQVQGAQLAEPRSMREDNEWTDLWTALPSEHDIETLFSYMQYQGLTNMLAISYIERFNSYGHNFALPESFTAWQNYLGWMNIFNLDLQAMAVWAGAYARGPAYEVFSNLPYSSLYLLVTAALPLAISFINLVLFYPLYQVIWLFLTVLSLVLTISCVLAKSILSEERLAVVGGGTLSPAFLSMLLYIGVGTFAAMLLALAIYRWYLMWLMLQKAQNKVDVVTRNLGRADTIALRQFLKTEKEEHEGPPPPLNDWIIVRNVWFTIVCALFATLDLYTNKALNIGPVIGIVLGVAGFVSIVYNLLTFFEKGRVLLRTAGRIIDRTAVSFFLMLLSILYMPITRMLFAIWLSSAAVCPAGTRFPIFANEISSSGSQWLASGVVECEPCEFESFNKYSLAWNVDFDSDGQCSTKFCPGETSVRSFQDPRLGYFDVILPFYAPASLLMLLGFTLGVPYLYYNIITKHTKMFSDTEDGGIEVRESRVGMETMKKHQGDVEWDYRVSGSNNRAKSLYSIFEFQFRFTKLVLVLQKLLIIAIVIFLYEYIVPAAFCVSLLHFSFMVYQMYTRPYFDPKSDALAIAVSFASSLNPLIIVLADYSVLSEIPFEVVVAVILFVNFGLPFLALGVGWVYSLRHRKVLVSKQDQLEHDFTEAEVLAIDKQRRKLDMELDRITLRYVLRVFVVMAFTGFISVALLVLGQFWQAATTKVVATTPEFLGGQFKNFYAGCQIEELMFKNELSDYTSWQQFTKNCCCSDRENAFAYGPEFQAGRTELWTCANGFSKERFRVGSTFIRKFCSPKFESGFAAPVFDSTSLQLVVKGPDASYGIGW